MSATTKILLLTAFVLLFSGRAWATTSGDSLAPTAVQGGGTGWTNWLVDTINTSDDKRAVYSGTNQNWAGATGFGFSITPVGTVVIDSIRVLTEGYGTSTTTARRIYNVQLLKAGVAAGTIYIDTLGITTDARIWNHNEAPLWGTTWSESDIENSGFGVQIRDGNTGTAAALNFDQVMIRVWWRDVTSRSQVMQTTIME